MLLLATALAWLGGSQGGLQWAYRQALPWLPGTLEIDRIEGRLFGPIRFEKIRYRDAARDIRANDLVFDWNPWALLAARLEVELIESEGIEIDLASTPATAESAGITEISLPLELTLRRLALSDLRFTSNGKATSLFSA